MDRNHHTELYPYPLSEDVTTSDDVGLPMALDRARQAQSTPESFILRHQRIVEALAATTLAAVYGYSYMHRTTARH